MQQTEQKHFNFLYKYTNGNKALDPQIQHIIAHIDDHYHKAKKVKANGGFRTLHKPTTQLKDIQGKILGEAKKISAERCIISESVFGLGDNGPRENVLPHLQNRHIFKTDIRDFFDNVNYGKVKMAFKTLGCDDKEAEILTRLCTYNYCIPQGAPTSPILASICLKHCDKRIENLCGALGMAYTRYADDITISCKNKITDKTQRNIKKIIRTEGLKMNEKTEIVDTRNEPCEITGVIVQNGTMMTAYHHGQRNHGLIVEKTPINQSEADRRLKGILEWIRHIDPEYYHALMNNQKCPHCS